MNFFGCLPLFKNSLPLLLFFSLSLVVVSNGDIRTVLYNGINNVTTIVGVVFLSGSEGGSSERVRRRRPAQVQ